MAGSKSKQDTSKKAATPAEWIHIKELIPWVRNPRINDHKVMEMVGKIKRWGFTSPIVAWRNAQAITYGMPHNVEQPAGHRIGAGHLRRKGMLWLLDNDASFCLPDAPGPGMVPVRFMHFPSEREYEVFVMQDNTKGGDWDEDELALLVAEHQRNFKEDFVGLGFDDKLIQDLGERGARALDALIDNSGVDMSYVPSFESDAASGPRDGSAPIISQTPVRTMQMTNYQVGGSQGQPPASPPAPSAAAPGPSAPPAAQKIAGATIHYDVIFDNIEQQERWYTFIKALKERYPNEPTLGARIDRFLTENPLV